MREGVSLRSASSALLTALLGVFGAGLSGCPSQAGPTDDALADYLRRHGIAVPDARMATPDGEAGEGGASGEGTIVGPIARRVAVTVERASGLPDLDSGPGETDPYVALDYEGQRFRSSVVEGEIDPVWGDTFIFDVRTGGVLVVKLMDEDSLSSDEQVGTQSQVLPDLQVGQTTALSLSFRNGEGGTLTLTLTGMVRP